jgi:hypothetical protein
LMVAIRCRNEMKQSLKLTTFGRQTSQSASPK